MATFDQAAAAIDRTFADAFAHSEHHRCPQLTHTNCSTVSPVGTSIAVSTRSVPSHVLHRTNSVSIDKRYAESKLISVQICTCEIAVGGPRRKWRFAFLFGTPLSGSSGKRLVTTQLHHTSQHRDNRKAPYAFCQGAKMYVGFHILDIETWRFAS